MKFKHIADIEKGIVVIKAVANLTVKDIMYEIQHAIVTKRGKGLPIRMIDLNNDTYDYSQDDLKLILDKLKTSANILETKRIAFLLNEFPKDYDIKSIMAAYTKPDFQIGAFNDKAQALAFINSAL